MACLCKGEVQNSNRQVGSTMHVCLTLKNPPHINCYTSLKKWINQVFIQFHSGTMDMSEKTLKNCDYRRYILLFSFFSKILRSLCHLISLYVRRFSLEVQILRFPLRWRSSFYIYLPWCLIIPTAVKGWGDTMPFCEGWSLEHDIIKPLSGSVYTQM